MSYVRYIYALCHQCTLNQEIYLYSQQPFGERSFFPDLSYKSCHRLFCYISIIYRRLLLVLSELSQLIYQKID